MVRFLGLLDDLPSKPIPALVKEVPAQMPVPSATMGLFCRNKTLKPNAVN